VVVIVVAFQSAFHAEMHKNDFFFIFFNYFLDQRIKTIKKHKKIILEKIIFFKNTRFLSTISFHPNISSKGCWNCVKTVFF